MADETITKYHTTKIKSEIRQERNKKRIEEDERQFQAERAAKLQERMGRKVISGVKKAPERSHKAATKKKEEKKQELTQEEVDHNKYLGQFAQMEEKKTN